MMRAGSLPADKGAVKQGRASAGSFRQSLQATCHMQGIQGLAFWSNIYDSNKISHEQLNQCDYTRANTEKQ